jgi:hypothetical protein
MEYCVWNVGGRNVGQGIAQIRTGCVEAAATVRFLFDRHVNNVLSSLALDE